jgi:hypothetical protein
MIMLKVKMLMLMQISCHLAMPKRCLEMKMKGAKV